MQNSGAVQDLSIEVSKGQSLLVVGHSGCGKSSLLRAIAGEALLSSHADKPLSPLLPSMLSVLVGLTLSLAFVPISAPARYPIIFVCRNARAHGSEG